jgi:hypothetical protein
VRLAEEGRAEREAKGRHRRRATIARNGIIQILANEGLTCIVMATGDDTVALLRKSKRRRSPDSS